MIVPVFKLNVASEIISCNNPKMASINIFYFYTFYKTINIRMIENLTVNIHSASISFFNIAYYINLATNYSVYFLPCLLSFVYFSLQLLKIVAHPLHVPAYLL